MKHNVQSDCLLAVSPRNFLFIETGSRACEETLSLLATVLTNLDLSQHHLTFIYIAGVETQGALARTLWRQ